MRFVACPKPPDNVKNAVFRKFTEIFASQGARKIRKKTECYYQGPEGNVSRKNLKRKIYGNVPLHKNTYGNY